MQEMLKIEKEKEKLKQEEEHKKDLQKLENLKIREKIQSLKSQFKNYSVVTSASTIEIRARLPNGKRVTQTFERSKTISFMKNYFIQLDDNGILEDIDEEDEEELEEENNMEITIMHGFPPKPLKENMTLSQCFGNSEGESVTVRKS
jgi:hypothetical protein